MCEGKRAYRNINDILSDDEILSREETKALAIYYADTLREILEELRRTNNSLVAIKKELRIRSDDGK
jgi:hypothetical protein